MITLLNSAAAFLKRDGNYLLMKRAENRKIAPDVWSGIGGRFEPHELNEPQAACLREIKEETGINAGQIRGLVLRNVEALFANTDSGEGDYRYRRKRPRRLPYGLVCSGRF